MSAGAWCSWAPGSANAGPSAHPQQGAPAVLRAPDSAGAGRHVPGGLRPRTSAGGKRAPEPSAGSGCPGCAWARERLALSAVLKRVQALLPRLAPRRPGGGGGSSAGFAGPGPDAAVTAAAAEPQEGPTSPTPPAAPAS